MTRNNRSLIDSNLVVYFFDRKSNFHSKTVSFLKKLKIEKNQLFLAQQNILEIEKVLIKLYKLNSKEVVSDIENFIEAMKVSLISPLKSTYLIYHQYLEKNPKTKDIFDLYLAATMIDNEVATIYTNNDKDFQGIGGIKAINPLK